MMFLIGTESTNYLDVDYWANIARFRSVSSFPHLICFPYVTLMSCNGHPLSQNCPIT